MTAPKSPASTCIPPAPATTVTSLEQVKAAQARLQGMLSSQITKRHRPFVPSSGTVGSHFLAAAGVAPLPPMRAARQAAQARQTTKKRRPLVPPSRTVETCLPASAAGRIDGATARTGVAPVQLQARLEGQTVEGNALSDRMRARLQ